MQADQPQTHPIRSLLRRARRLQRASAGRNALLLCTVALLAACGSSKPGGGAAAPDATAPDVGSDTTAVGTPCSQDVFDPDACLGCGDAGPDAGSDVTQDVSAPEVCRLGAFDLGFPKRKSDWLYGAPLDFDDLTGRSIWFVKSEVLLDKGKVSPGQYAISHADLVLADTGELILAGQRGRLGQEGTVVALTGYQGSPASWSIPLEDAASTMPVAEVFDSRGVPIGSASYPMWPESWDGKWNSKQFGYRNGSLVVATSQAPLASATDTPSKVARLRLYGIDMASAATWTVVRPDGPNEKELEKASGGPGPALLHPLASGGWLVISEGLAWEVAADGSTVAQWTATVTTPVWAPQVLSNFPPTLRYLQGRVVLYYDPFMYFNTYHWALVTTSGQVLAVDPVPDFWAYDFVPGPGGTIHIPKALNQFQPKFVHVLVVDNAGKPIAYIENAYPISESQQWTPALPLKWGMLSVPTVSNPPYPAPFPGFLLSDWWYNPSCETSGPCWQKTYADCSDQNPCTSDLCDGAHNGCYHAPLPDGITCSDSGGHCAAGSCK